ncbi:MAG: DUF3667 domain-containing protein [Cyclobacteriaceae bacterium]|nr:DUF3667 domain-containing protein [Cyclobacteriaceae bacterium]
MSLLFTKRPDRFDYQASRTCRNCESVFQGKFCPRCGEKVVESYERSVRYFADDLLNALTSLDGKFITSLKMLLTNPGRMSADIVAGKRVPYMRMVSLFFVANFFYFLFPIFEAFNTSFNSQYSVQPYSSMIRPWVDARLAATGTSIEAYAETFNQQSSSNAKLLLVFIVFVFSWVLYLINWKRKEYYADHLTLSFEFMSFTIFFPTLLMSTLLLVALKLAALVGLDWSRLFYDEIISPVILLFILYFFVRAQVTFYGASWLKAGLRSLLMFLGFAATMVAFRFALFLVTYWMA